MYYAPRLGKLTLKKDNRGNLSFKGAVSHHLKRVMINKSPQGGETLQ
jgi:hypothetical protein